MRPRCAQTCEQGLLLPGKQPREPCASQQHLLGIFSKKATSQPSVRCGSARAGSVRSSPQDSATGCHSTPAIAFSPASRRPQMHCCDCGGTVGAWRVGAGRHWQSHDITAMLRMARRDPQPTYGLRFESALRAGQSQSHGEQAEWHGACASQIFANEKPSARRLGRGTSA
jgi:hypothetical protein